jgi:LPXTG-motif cell wall-anchored protein
MANGIQACDKPNEVMPELEVNPSAPIEEVLGIRVSKAPAVAAAVQPAVAAQPAVEVAGAVLPFTGGEALTFLVAAFALMLAGAAVLMFRRSEA